MAHLLSPLPTRKRCTFTMLCGSLLFHGTLVGTAALWIHPSKTDPIDKGPTIVDIVDNPGPPEDFKPLDPPAFAPPENVSPVEQDPLVDLDTPPDLTQDIVDPEPIKPTAPPRTTPVRKPAKPTIASSGAVPRSNPNAGAGTNGASGLGTGQPGNDPSAVGWKITKPIYPAALRSQHIQGIAKIKITTDAAGHISEVVILKSTGNSSLDENTTRRVRSDWSGPPNASTTREVEYQLH